MTDRRRLNPPAGGTSAPLFAKSPDPTPSRTRPPSQPRRIFLQTGLVPSASGSAYYETSPSASSDSFSSATSSLKLTVTVHGPRPLPRQTPYSPTLLLNTHVKFAPFATRVRRGYVRDAVERDLGAHLETALRGVILAERFPKSACDVVVTILEGEEQGEGKTGVGGVGLMSVLAGAITASSAALVDAGIDCVDLVSGGVAGRVKGELVVDPVQGEHEGVEAVGVVGYLQSRDEVTELWVKGDVGADPTALVDKAVEAAQMSRVVLAATLRNAVERKLKESAQEANGTAEATG
ncbi:3' exoribonuclease family, domain 1-domain-containing protein [Elsinoe ampelina]|uniref:3' exoribonuclease family, domain 1-domain-containing protein n=1 Tax=Elsinoe ampelina TaxID=302913 RepID=A0A6A6GME9_9PEZI|nr:3' exoribonuclease family, domain 1-domain-containing protein [Elsinoe ampelina]